jgi:hypothetical protein
MAQAGTTAAGGGWGRVVSVLDIVLGQLGLINPPRPPGLHEFTLWVPLPISKENSPFAGGTYSLISSSRDIAALRALFTVVKPAVTIDYLAGLMDKGLIRADPADATKFQVNLGLRVVYPAAKGNPNAIAGKGKLPLVLLNHGHAPNWKPQDPPIPVGGGSTAVKPSDFTITPNLDGYAYLQDALAALNIISVSVDHNFACFQNSFLETRADTITAALDALNTQATTKGNRYFGRLDFSRIGLMGHSRGGDGVVRAVKKIIADPTLSGKYTLKTVCSLAPTDFTGSLAPANRMFLDENDLIFYHLLYGALDNDVSGADGATGGGGTGFRHYDRARCRKSMVFVDTCCHDYFNSVWAASPVEVDLTDLRIATPAVHQDIAIDYVGDLFAWQLTSARQPQRFDGRTGNRSSVHASIQWMFGQQLQKIDDFENPAANLLGGTRTVMNPGAPTSIDDMASIMINGNTLAAHTGHQTHVLNVDLTQGTPGSTRVLTDTIPPANQNWSLFNTLIVSVAGWFDPTSAATIAAAPQPHIKVTLIDTANVTASADWTQYGAALPSRPIFKSPPSFGNITLMRLETIAIPMSALAGPDLTKIATVAVDIDPGNNTHVFVDNIHAVQR